MKRRFTFHFTFVKIIKTEIEFKSYWLSKKCWYKSLIYCSPLIFDSITWKRLNEGEVCKLIFIFSSKILLIGAFQQKKKEEAFVEEIGAELEVYQMDGEVRHQSNHQKSLKQFL